MKDQPMNFYLAECLIVLVNESHVTRAAERLEITQPKMSAILARLRRLLNDPVLVKTADGMIPTDQAIALAEEVKPFLSRWTALVKQGEDFEPAEAERCFTIRTSDPIARKILISALQLIQQETPKISLSVESRTNSNLSEDLASDLYDLAIVWSPELSVELMASKLTSFRLVCLAAKDHPRIGSSISWDQFAAERQICLTRGSWSEPINIEQEVEAVFSERNQERRIALNTSSPFSVPEIVSETNLIAVLPDWVASWGERHFPVRTIELPFALAAHDVQMVWHERRKNDPGLKWLRDILRNCARLEK